MEGDIENEQAKMLDKLFIDINKNISVKKMEDISNELSGELCKALEDCRSNSIPLDDTINVIGKIVKLNSYYYYSRYVKFYIKYNTSAILRPFFRLKAYKALIKYRKLSSIQTEIDDMTLSNFLNKTL